jgi:hypothetical protein
MHPVHSLCLALILALMTCDAFAADCDTHISMNINGLASSASRCVTTASTLKKSNTAASFTCVACSMINISTSSSFCKATIKATFSSKSSLSLFYAQTSAAVVAVQLINNKTVPCGLKSSMTTLSISDRCGGKSSSKVPSSPCPRPKTSPPLPPLPSPPVVALTTPVCDLVIKTPTSSLSTCSAFLSLLSTGGSNLTLGIKPPKASGCATCVSTDDYGDCIVKIVLSFYSISDLLRFFGNTGAVPWTDDGAVTLPPGSINKGYDALVMDVLPNALGFAWNGCNLYSSSLVDTRRNLGSIQSILVNSMCGVSL